MARIRSIKPEFPQSESMGNVSRDARLTFIMLWTLADDEGRLRGNSRMLASLLFPYDDDAPSLIDTWLGELEKEQCIQRYKIEGQNYIQLCNWLNHQKIDHPSKSKIPPFAKPRESSRKLVVGSRIKGSKDQGEEGKGRGEEGDKPPVGPAPDAVETIFAYWQKKMDSPKSALDGNRRGLIEKALKSYTPEQICKAIRGCSKTPHNMGDNERGAKYNGLDLILRNAEKIDYFIRLDDAPPPPAGAGLNKQEALEQRNREIAMRLAQQGDTTQ